MMVTLTSRLAVSREVDEKQQITGEFENLHITNFQKDVLFFRNTSQIGYAIELRPQDTLQLQKIKLKKKSHCKGNIYKSEDVNDQNLSLRSSEGFPIWAQMLALNYGLTTTISLESKTVLFTLADNVLQKIKLVETG